MIKQLRVINEQKAAKKSNKPVLSRLFQTIRSSNSNSSNKRKDELLVINNFKTIILCFNLFIYIYLFS